MTNIILADTEEVRAQLLPLTVTRPISHIMVGIGTIAQKWQRMLPGHYSYLTVGYLSEKFPLHTEHDNLIIASHILPTPELVKSITTLNHGEALKLPDGTIAARRGDVTADVNTFFVRDFPEMPRAITHLYDIFTANGETIRRDFADITAGRTSQSVSQSCTVIGDPSMIFIEPGATVEGAFLNTKSGPIYIGANAEVMEGSCLRGPIAIMDHVTVNMGTKIYSDTTIGNYCKVGGELNNVVMHPYSNKAHDGFLGNAVIGSWCNLGAGCVASNLKNDYTEIKLWNYPTRRFMRTGLQFCGLIMGDHSKAGINTMFNTATVVGVGVNIHGTGFPRNFVASFTEGSVAGFADVPPAKFFNIARRVMARRGIELTESDERLYTALYEITETYK